MTSDRQERNKTQRHGRGIRDKQTEQKQVKETKITIKTETWMPSDTIRQDRNMAQGKRLR